jgi:hypothetical protein
MDSEPQPRLYTDLAAWWPLFSPATSRRDPWGRDVFVGRRPRAAAGHVDRR